MNAERDLDPETDGLQMRHVRAFLRLGGPQRTPVQIAAALQMNPDDVLHALHVMELTGDAIKSPAYVWRSGESK